MDEESRRSIQYGVMLLKILADYKASFVEECKDTIYSFRSLCKEAAYTTYFYLNGDTIVLLHCFQNKSL